MRRRLLTQKVDLHAAGIGIERIRDAPLDLGHLLLGVVVHLLVVELQALLGGEGRIALGLGAPVKAGREVRDQRGTSKRIRKGYPLERPHARVGQHVDLEIAAILEEFLATRTAHHRRVAAVHLLRVALQCRSRS